MAVIFCCAARAQAWNARDHVALTNFVIQSHRGAGELAPENTLEAFELGWQLGTYPEADVRTTKDGVIVAFHDNTFERVVKGVGPELRKKGVADVTFEELSRLDVGAWKGEKFTGRHVSRISEVFARMQGRSEHHLYLDMKNVDLKQLGGEVKQFGVERQVVLASPRHEILREWKALVPQSDTLLWMGGSEADLAKRLRELRQDGFSALTQVQLHVRLNTNNASSEPFNLSRAFLSATADDLAQHRILFQTLPYGATNENIYWQLLDLGVASFATDHPEVTLKAVRDYYEGRR